MVASAAQGMLREVHTHPFTRCAADGTHWLYSENHLQAKVKTKTGQKKHQAPPWRAANGDEDGNDDDSISFPSGTEQFSLVPAQVFHWQIQQHY